MQATVKYVSVLDSTVKHDQIIYQSKIRSGSDESITEGKQGEVESDGAWPE